jgi:predicted RNase H-like HicB family nuclease
MEKIKVIIDWEDNYGAASNEVLGCVATHKTLEGVKDAYASALKFHLEGMRDGNDEVPVKLQSEYQLEFELTAQALLYYFDGIITRAALSRITGINQRQLGHYMTRHRVPRLAQRRTIIDGLHYIGKELIAVM